MINFKKMLKIAHERHSPKDPNSVRLLKLMKECEIFVFKPIGEQKDIEIPESVDGCDFDAPFKTFAIEFSGNTPVTSMSPEDIAQGDGGVEDVKIRCIVATEVAPREFDFFLLVELVETGGIVMHYRIMGASADGDSGLHKWCIQLFDKMMDRMNSEKMGLETISDKFKIGSGKNKYFHKIKRVIHVAPKKLHERVESCGSRVIDWSHRWSVRGHWRTCNGIGKDRDGNYCVEGKTWVEAHEKGPEEAELIKKQRVVYG